MKKAGIIAGTIIVLVLLAVAGWVTNYVFYGDVSEVSIEVPDLVTEEFIPVQPDIILDNPYEDVDWDIYGQHKANLHTHTRESDGWFQPERVIDEYHERGYTILALADHNNVTWPWEDYGRDPAELGMLAIQANEISDTHHIGSYFNDFDIDGRRYWPYYFPTGSIADIDEREVIEAIGEKGGLAVIFHPGRYEFSPEQYAEFYMNYDHVVGMEVINQGDRYEGDREMWDEVLTMVMPDYPVWGFANDDMHVMRHMAHCYNVFLLSHLNEAEFRSAMETGQFYFSHGDAPVINSITVDNDEGVVSIDADDWDKIIWISDGRAIHSGDTFEFTSTPNVGSYVRAKIYGDEGNTYTNPFGVRPG